MEKTEVYKVKAEQQGSGAFSGISGNLQKLSAEANP